MNVSELKQVAEMVSTMSGDASQAFSVWVYLEIFENVWQAAVFVTVLMLLGRWLRPAMSLMIAEGRSTALLKRFRDTLRVGSTGTLTPRELNEVEDKIITMINEDK